MEINKETEILNLLKDLNQNHILEVYQKHTTEEKQAFINQIEGLEKSYPGGIREYCNRAKIFLTKSKNNENPYEKYVPSVPEGENLEIGIKILNLILGSENFLNLEQIGLEQLEYTGFTLVAGGLGERLGYDDIKIGIPVSLITRESFIDIYCQYLLAYEHRIRKMKPNLSSDFMVPLCIMTSDDTYSRTVAILNENNNFGLRKDQITIVKQDKVPALLNNDCHLALIPGKLLIDTKPHGHGDVHTVLHQNGVVEKWSKMGKKW